MRRFLFAIAAFSALAVPQVLVQPRHAAAAQAVASYAQSQRLPALSPGTFRKRCVIDVGMKEGIIILEIGMFRDKTARIDHVILLPGSCDAEK